MNPFEEFDTVQAWLEHVERTVLPAAGCYRAGGGPPPPRSAFENCEGFWVRGPGYDSHRMYTWVPDEIAARDSTGRYHAGQHSP